MIVGAGEMSELATRYLMVNGVRSVFDRAQKWRRVSMAGQYNLIGTR